MATHQPVVFHLALPENGLFTLRFRFPKSFVSLGVEESDLTAAAERVLPSSPSVDTLQEWGALVEDVARDALKHAGVEAGLPKAFRGRCRPLKPLRQPVHSAIKPASNGDYNPPVEVITMATRRKVKQLRRVDSLFQRLVKFERRGATTICTKQELYAEWQAILRC